jgi:hypothetical protein
MTAPAYIAVIPYERRLDALPMRGLGDADKFFSGKGALHESVRRFATALAAHEIPYAVAGEMAMYHFGFRQFVPYLEVLLTREGLHCLVPQLDEHGFAMPSPFAKHCVDATTGVRIHFFIADDYTDNDTPLFTDLDAAVTVVNGVRYLRRPSLVTLKLVLASRATLSKHLGDVQQLISTLRLPVELADDLHPSVREIYRFHCEGIRATWRFVDLERRLSRERIALMLHDGVQQESNGWLVTTDPKVAEKYEMCPEEEFWEDCQ